MNQPMYLDYAATTPMATEVALAMAECLTLEGDFANPASLQHSFGERAYNLIERWWPRIRTSNWYFTDSSNRRHGHCT